jgi:hypothetical protein
MSNQDPIVNELTIESNDWNNISEQKLSEEFMTKFSDKLIW